MKGQIGIQNNPWLVCPRPNPQASLRLFCFPYSGADARIFYPWLDILPATIEVCPVQLPGRGNRLDEPPFNRLTSLVQTAAEALLPSMDKPFVFFGHSMGALVSFELARLLDQRYDLLPLRLFVSGCRAPQLPDQEPPVHDLPEPEFVAQLRRLNGMSEQVLDDAELMDLLLPILRADFAVCETYAYQPGPPLACPISAFAGLRDEFVSRDHLQAWREQTTAAFSLRMFPGDHFYLNTDRQLLLRTLARELIVSWSQQPQVVAGGGLKTGLATAGLEWNRR